MFSNRARSDETGLMEEPSGPLPSVWSILGEDMVSGRWGSGQNYPLHPQLGLLIDHTRTGILEVFRRAQK